MGQDEIRRGGVHIKNIDVLQHVSQSRVDISINWFPQFGTESVIALVILSAQIIRLVIKKLPAERKASVEEVRFGQGQDEIFPLRTVLDAQPEFLAASGKRRPVEEIEIALGEFRESYQLIDGAEPTAKAERAGPFFLHLDRQIFPAGYVCLFRIRLDFCEVAQVLQTFLRYIYPNSVKDISRRDEDFAADYLVFGARVALDIDSVYKRADAFLDFIVHVDLRGSGRLAFRQNDKIDVPAAAVRIGHCLRIIAQLFWRIDATFLHF